MSIQDSQDIEDFNLPLKWRPGTDLMSKMLLCEPKVIDLVVHSLVGADIPANSYTVSPTEWADGSRSDIVYTPQTLTKSLPPILIEIQYNIDQMFMLRLIKYSSNAFCRYKMLPIVLVVATKSFSSAFKTEFTPSECGLFLETSCRFWAKHCVVMTPEAVYNHLHKPALNPMAALGCFLIRTECKIPHHLKSNATMTMLFSIAEDLLSRKDTKNITNSSVVHHLKQVKRNLEKIIEEDKGQQDRSKKIKSCAQESILSIQQLERDLQDDSEEKESKQTIVYTEDDVQFIENTCEPGKNKNWKYIFDKGKAEGLFKSYKSSDSLKSSYYHIKRRKRQHE